MINNRQVKICSPSTPTIAVMNVSRLVIFLSSSGEASSLYVSDREHHGSQPVGLYKSKGRGKTAPVSPIASGRKCKIGSTHLRIVSSFIRNAMTHASYKINDPLYTNIA
eukprot:292778_1